MKKLRIALISLVLALSTMTMKAQLAPLDFLSASSSDAGQILEEYFRPYANILGANLNAGWYNTAKPHKLGGFDITTTFSVAFAPIEALTYDLNDLALNLDFDANNSIAPTIAGDVAALPELVVSETVNVDGSLQTFEVGRMEVPNGLGVNFLPLPMAQASLGLFKGTDVTVRFVPTLEIGEYGDFGVFGIGGRHSISQWIPVLKRLDFINIAVQGGYTKISANAFLDVQPNENIEVQPVTTHAFDDQSMSTTISGWTVNLIASQSIPIITVYEGIGFASSAMEFAILGHYPLNSVVTDVGADFGKTTYLVAEDPIELLEFENNKNLRLNAGIRFKLGILTIHYDFTRTLYSTHSAGIGISFR